MTLKLSDSYISTFARLAELTVDRCHSCRVSYACCNATQCEQTRLFALETFGIELAAHGKILPFLGESGCSVPPHLRPICTVHVCELHLHDPIFEADYMELRKAAGEELERQVEATS